MTPQQLRNSILQMAIEGKLTRQLPEDGNAADLLKKIKAEKAKLIKEKKIKKEKPLPEIGDDEIPFEVPENWRWVRLIDIIRIINGDRGKNYPAKNKLSETGEIPFISAANISGNTISLNDLLYMTREQHSALSRGHLRQGDLVLCIRGSLGKNGIYPFKEGAIASSLVILRNYVVNTISYMYISMYFKSLLFDDEIHKYDNGTAQPNLGARDLAKFLVPLPPLGEQKRIVARLEEILPLVDAYEKAYNELKELNKKFPVNLKNSLLQMAIEGKLVEQRPEDGNAADLLKKIKEEKAKLIKEKKIKKEKPLPEIREDEIPFEIPDNWVWTRIGEVFSLQAGKNISSSSINTKGKYKCFGGNGVRGYVDIYNQEGMHPIIGRQGALCGNIQLADGRFYATEHAVVTDLYVDTDARWASIFLRALNLNQYATATAQPGLAVNKINSVVLPLPPLAEQKRIVAKLEQLLPLCDELMKHG